MWKTLDEGTEAKGIAAVVAGSEGEDMDVKNRHQLAESILSSTRTAYHATRGKKTGKNRFIHDGPRLAIFSDYLMTLELTLTHKTCELTMHWLGLAARNGRLQNLENVKFDGRRPKWPSRYRHKEPPLRLSLLLLFLRSLPRLKDLMLGLGDIYDDFPDALVDFYVSTTIRGVRQATCCSRAQEGRTVFGPFSSTTFRHPAGDTPGPWF
jgi:hypothetical protein